MYINVVLFVEAHQNLRKKLRNSTKIFEKQREKKYSNIINNVKLTLSYFNSKNILHYSKI